MNKDLIRMRCDRVLIESQPALSKILNNRIQKVYEKHEDALSMQLDYDLLTNFTNDVLIAFSGVISEVMVRIIQEVLSEDDFENFGELER